MLRGAEEQKDRMRVTRPSVSQSHFSISRWAHEVLYHRHQRGPLRQPPHRQLKPRPEEATHGVPMSHFMTSTLTLSVFFCGNGTSCTHLPDESEDRAHFPSRLKLASPRGLCC